MITWIYKSNHIQKSKNVCDIDILFIFFYCNIIYPYAIYIYYILFVVSNTFITFGFIGVITCMLLYKG